MMIRSNAQWYAIHTKYKCEKYVAKQLRIKGLESYVPVLIHTKQHVRKVKSYEIPLITCYAFVKIDLEERIKVLATPYVHGFLSHGGRIIAIPRRRD